MIGKLKGKIEEIDKTFAYIDTKNGVVYKVYASPSLLSKVGKEVCVYTYLDVKEDALNLFAFETKDAYNLYLKLISVDGVGPKLAYTICSYCPAQDIVNAVTEKNVDFFIQIRGVGKKTAHRILLDLSESLGEELELQSILLSSDDLIVLEALETLGFKKSQSRQILQKHSLKGTIEDKIKESIKLLTENK